MGSLISADILRENKEERWLNFRVNCLLTMGSPAPMFDVIREGDVPQIPNVKLAAIVQCVDKWINVGNANDLIAFRFGMLVDVQCIVA